MMEHLGYAAMTETPCVIVDVQRGGPSTGLPTLPGQADMMQARWGSHGDYEVIALCPLSPQECFDLTIEAFNLSERFRVPVLVMMDECVGHMTERVVIPPANEIEVYPRRYTRLKPGDYKPYAAGADGVPEMVRAGRGYHFHITGLTHDERGYPAMNADAQKKLVGRLIAKIRENTEAIVRYEEKLIEDAEIIVLAYGITARVAERAVQMARERGIAAGLLRPVVVWPFPEKRIRELAGRARAFVVAEMNYGQIALEVERLVAGRAPTVLVSHAGGAVHHPEEILDAILAFAPRGEGAGRRIRLEIEDAAELEAHRSEGFVR
jgi:2-oxoglutarate ferredoxin oxidoreductase subunit alpha